MPFGACRVPCTRTEYYVSEGSCQRTEFLPPGCDEPAISGNCPPCAPCAPFNSQGAGICTSDALACPPAPTCHPCRDTGVTHGLKRTRGTATHLGYRPDGIVARASPSAARGAHAFNAARSAGTISLCTHGDFRWMCPRHTPIHVPECGHLTQNVILCLDKLWGVVSPSPRAERVARRRGTRSP